MNTSISQAPITTLLACREVTADCEGYWSDRGTTGGPAKPRVAIQLETSTGFSNSKRIGVSTLIRMPALGSPQPKGHAKVRRALRRSGGANELGSAVKVSGTFKSTTEDETEQWLKEILEWAKQEGKGTAAALPIKWLSELLSSECRDHIQSWTRFGEREDRKTDRLASRDIQALTAIRNDILELYSTTQDYLGKIGISTYQADLSLLDTLSAKAGSPKSAAYLEEMRSTTAASFKAEQSSITAAQAELSASRHFAAHDVSVFAANTFAIVKGLQEAAAAECMTATLARAGLWAKFQNAFPREATMPSTVTDLARYMDEVGQEEK